MKVQAQGLMVHQEAPDNLGASTREPSEEGKSSLMEEAESEGGGGVEVEIVGSYLIHWRFN